MTDYALTGRSIRIRIDEPTDFGIIVSGIEPIESGFGWVLLRTRRGCPPPERCFFGGYLPKKGMDCYVLASIAFGHPYADLSGIFLKPLRAWDYPNKLPFVPKRRCLLDEI